MSHTCHALGCKSYCPPVRLMCSAHWRMVPKDVQSLVWDTYRVGQCDDKRPSLSWFLAAAKAITAVAVSEGRMSPTDAERYVARRQRWLDEAHAAAIERQHSDSAPVA